MKIHSIRFKITAIIVVVIMAALLTIASTCYVLLHREADRTSVEMMNLIGQRVAAGDENWNKETAPAADSIVCKPKCKKKTEDGVFGEMCAFPDDRLVDCDEPHQFSIGGLFPFCRIIDIENEPCHKLRCLCAVIGRLRRKQEDNYRKSDRRQKESKAHRKIVTAYMLPAVLISDIKKHSLPLITRTFI